MFSDLFPQLAAQGTTPTPDQAAAAEATRQLRATAFDIALRLARDIDNGHTEFVFGGSTPSGLLDALMLRAAAQSGVNDQDDYLRRLSAHLADVFASFGVHGSLIVDCFGTNRPSRALREASRLILENLPLRNALTEFRRLFIEQPDHGASGETPLFDGLKVFHLAGVSIRTGASTVTNKRVSAGARLTYEQRHSLRNLSRRLRG